MPPEATVPNPGDVAASACRSHQLCEVLAIPAFRQLWIALGLSSLGDWLGLLAATAFAASLASGYRGSLYATGGVLASRLAPAVLFGPFAGAFADRFDRRKQMVLCDLIRGGAGDLDHRRAHAAVPARGVVRDRDLQPVLDPRQGGVGPQPGAARAARGGQPDLAGDDLRHGAGRGRAVLPAVGR